MNILVTYAVDAEFAPWRALVNLEKITLGNITLQCARIGRTTVHFLVTGMGTVGAEHAAASVISRKYSFCIAAGFAGALQSSVKLKQIVAPDKVLDHFTGQTEKCDPNLLAQASKNGATSIVTLLTTDHVVIAATEKNRLSSLAGAVDMESFAILHAANKANVPCAVLRVISDSFDRDMPEEIDTLVDPQGHVNISGVVRYVAKHPLQLPALMRLGRDSKSAAEALAHFLESFINKFVSATHGAQPSALQEIAS